MKLSGYTPEMVHIGFGMVSLPEGKMSTRKGRVVFLEEVIEKLVNLTKKTIQKKNPNLKNKDKIAKSVAIGALKFADLSQNKIKNIVFDWDKILDLTGDTGPYLQYAHVRCNSILQKEKPKSGKPIIKISEEKQLVMKLAEFPNVVEKAGIDYSIHSLAQYLLELAHIYSNFYEKCPVLNGENKNTRLQLVAATKNVLKIGLNLLGIEAPEKM